MAWRDYLTEQRRLNESTRPNREFFAEHRQQVTQLLLGARRDVSDRLCILAAGNCNDIELEKLANHYAQVHLVDADASALSYGIEQAGCDSRDDVIAHREVDLTGIAHRLGAGTASAELDVSAVRELIEESRAFTGPTLGGPFAVVASTCLLSQLVDALAVGRGPQTICRVRRHV